MKNHTHHHEVISTNTLLKEMMLYDNSLPHLSVVSASFQTSGRGQRENHWESERDKNLLFSLLLKPENMSAYNAFSLSKIVSVAIVRWLSQYVQNVKIKWPNDIYCGNKKICGILIENSLMGNNLNTSIVGVGININQTEFSKDLPNPVSLAQLTGKSYNLQDMLAQVVNEIEEQYNAHFRDEESNIDAQYHQALYQLNRLCKYRSLLPAHSDEDALFEATIVGVCQNGSLMLQCKDNSISTFAFKEIEFL